MSIQSNSRFANLVNYLRLVESNSAANRRKYFDQNVKYAKRILDEEPDFAPMVAQHYPKLAPALSVIAKH